MRTQSKHMFTVQVSIVFLFYTWLAERMAQKFLSIYRAYLNKTNQISISFKTRLKNRFAINLQKACLVYN